MARIAINGLGGIGRLVLRALLDAGSPGEIVLLNDASGAAAPEPGPGGAGARRTRHPRIEALPLAELGVDLVIDCTGTATTPARTRPYFAAGVAKVLVSTPVRGEGALEIVYGVNHAAYDPAAHHLVGAAGGAANSLAPVVKVLQEGVGILHGSMTVIRDAGAAPTRGVRRGPVPSGTPIQPTPALTQALARLFPELEGRLDGHAVQVPLLSAALADCAFEMARETDRGELNALFRGAAEGALAGVLGFEPRALVSADYVDDPRSAIIDGPTTMVVSGTQARIYAWADTDCSQARRMADIAGMIAARMPVAG